MDHHARRATISVIIPARNAADLIADCVESVTAQLEDGDEIIVVDDDSSDATPEMCAALGARVVRNSRSPGPYGARNVGVELSTGTALLFFDARCRASTGWLAAHRRALDDADGPAVSYSDVAVLELDGLAPKVASHMNPFSVGTYRNQGFFPACNLGMTRALFDAVGGFEEVRSGADADLCRQAVRAGASLVADPMTRVGWRPREHLSELLEQYHRYGESAYRLAPGHSGRLVGTTVALLGVHMLGTFIGKPSLRSRPGARAGAALVQMYYDLGILQAAMSDVGIELRRA